MKNYETFWDGIEKVPFEDVGHILRRREMAKNIPQNAKRILSIGSGFGEELLDFRRKNSAARIFCLDLSTKALDVCKRTLDAETVIGDVQNLPFKDDYFDVICILEVLEHLHDDARAVREVRRVLKGNGTVIASVPSPPLTKKWREHGHLRHYTRAEFIDLFGNAGGFIHVKDLNYYDRLRYIYTPFKDAYYMMNKALGNDREYVETWPYTKIISPFFLFLSRFEEGMEPLRRKNIAVFRIARRVK